MRARVFVFIPVYNASAFVSETIESVLAQTYEDWQMLVLDDQSTDNSFEICKSFEKRDSRITVKRNIHNLGMVGNWNEGISKCENELFIKLDADDKWLPTMLEKSVEVIDSHEDVGMVFSKYVNIDLKGDVVIGSEITLPEFARNKSFSCVPLVQLGADKMLQYSILRQGVSVIKKSLFKEIGIYHYLITKETEASSDTEFYFRVGCNHNIYCIDETLYQYRIHQESISARDAVIGLSQQKLFEIKTVINDYYFGQNKITWNQWRSNKRKTHFRYLLYKQYVFRLNKKYTSLCAVIFRLLVFYPDKVFIHMKDKLLVH